MDLPVSTVTRSVAAGNTDSGVAAAAAVVGVARGIVLHLVLDMEHTVQTVWIEKLRRIEPVRHRGRMNADPHETHGHDNFPRWHCPHGYNVRRIEMRP
jgi:hypothetical protein